MQESDVVADVCTVLLEAVLCQTRNFHPLFVNFARVSSPIVKRRLQLSNLVDAIGKFQHKEVVEFRVTRGLKIPEIDGRHLFIAKLY